MAKIYPCNGKRECSKSEGCYVNGGDCIFTTDVEYKSDKYIKENTVSPCCNYLTDAEKLFLSACIFMAGEEGFYLFDRDHEKYKDFGEVDLKELMLKLGASEEDIENILNF